MHVLLIHQSFAALDEPGGTRHYEFARYLAEQGHRVTVIASPVSYLTGDDQSGGRRSERQAFPGGGEVNIVRAYTYSALHRSFLHRVFSYLSFMLSSFLEGMKVRQVDLVWGTSPPIFQGVTALALARLKRAPFLFEVRDLWPAFAVAVGVLRQPVLIRASEWLERFLYQDANLVVVNSPGFLEHVRQRGAAQVALVPNGADSRMFDPQSAGAGFRQDHHLAGKYVVLYAGAHGISNDLEVALEAACLLRDRPQVALVFLGAGKEKANLVRKAAEMALENVLFLPPISKEEMPQALAAADACLAILKPVPLYATVYPNKVFDYMAAGRPVVLAIDGVIRQVIEKSAAGIYAPPGDPAALAAAIRRLADDPQTGQAMGKRGRQAVEAEFDRAAVAEKLAALMQSLHR
jgi:glycosyltransferase involved in cell wall biosynthesis